MRSTIVPLFAEYQIVEIGENSLALLRKMLLLIKEAFPFLCVIPISAGILFISVTIFIELFLKVRFFFFSYNYILENYGTMGYLIFLIKYIFRINC